MPTRPTIARHPQPASPITPRTAVQPTPRTPKPQPAIRQLAAQRLLDDFAERLASAASGSLALPGFAPGAHVLTSDLLRALDAYHAADASTMITLPAWLRIADETAQAELAAWYPARGLPSPDDRDDPGECQGSAGAADRHVTYPRPNATTREAQVVEFLKCRVSAVYFADSYLNIREPAHQGVIPFRLWRWQAWLLHQWDAHALNIALKSRQIGATELAAAYGLWQIRFHDTKEVLVVSKDEMAAKRLTKRAVGMLEHAPSWLIPGKQQGGPHPQQVDAATIGTANTMAFEIVHRDRAGRTAASLMESLPATAGTGRSATAALVILDEWAYQQWAEEIWGAIEPTISAGGKLIGFSTANGTGNLFFHLWRSATRPKDDVPAIEASTSAEIVAESPPVEADTDAPETAMEPTPEDAFFSVFLSWRRHPRRDAAWYAREERRYQDQPHKLHQEYPSAPTEAFIQSGRPVFDSSYLSEHERRIEEELAARRAEGLPPWRSVDGLTIFEEPVVGHAYIVGADVAEGLETGDWDDASVVDRQTGREVAALHGHWPADVYAAKLDELAWRYNCAELAVERENHGHSVIVPLLNGTAHERWHGSARTAYPRLYHFKPEWAPGSHQDRRPGWSTNLHTKPLMIDALARQLREHTYLPRTRAFLDEALVFAHDEDGKMGAPSGCFTPGTLVLSANGCPLPIDALESGNRVITHDGEGHMITETFERHYEGDITRIKASGLPYLVEATPEHPFWVRRRTVRNLQRRAIRKEFPPDWVAAKDIQPGDWLAVPKRRGLPPTDLTPEQLYAIGFWLAEGHITHGWNGAPRGIGLTNTNKAFIERAVPVLEAMFPDDRVKYGNDRVMHWENVPARSRMYLRQRPKKVASQPVYEWALYSRDAADYFTPFGRYSWEKHLPDDLFTQSDLLPLVSGLIDGDGTQRLNQQRDVVIYTTSEMMAWQVRQILIDNGIWCTIRTMQPKPSLSPDGHLIEHPRRAWQLNIKAGYLHLLPACKVVPFARQRDTFHVIEDEAYFYTAVRAVTTVLYNGPVYNLAVEDRHSYVAGGVAVHNCNDDTVMARAIAVYLLSTISTVEWMLTFSSDLRAKLRDRVNASRNAGVQPVAALPGPIVDADAAPASAPDTAEVSA